MAPVLHARFSASAAERWIACPVSVPKSDGIPDKPSAAADEGTKAHAVAEEALTKLTFLHGDVKPEGEMQEGAALYTETVYAYRIVDSVLEIEKQSPGLASIDEDLGGTTDTRLYRPVMSDIVVIDYKYGKGYAVEAVENKQMLTYALGALIDAEPGVAYDEVEMTIVQPRAYHPAGPVRSWRVPVARVWQHAEDVLAAIAEARSGEGKPKPGKHCHFCPALITCPAHTAVAEFSAQQVQHDTGFPGTLSAGALAEAADLADILDMWVSAVRKELAARIGAGQHVPGFKAVQKRGTRAWVNEGVALAAILARFKASREDVTITKLASPAAVEKIVGKAQMRILADVITSESSGWTVAPESDTRPAVNVGPVSEFTPVG